MKRAFITIFMIFFFAVCGAVGLFALYPWKEMLGQKIAGLMEEQGLPNVSLDVASVDPRGIALKNLRFGEGGHKNLIPEVLASYTLEGLQKKKIETLRVRGLDVRVRQGAEGWSVDGFDWSAQEEAQPFVLPVTKTYFDALPVDEVSLSQGHLDISAQAGAVRVPLDVVFQKLDAPGFSLSSALLSFKGDGVSLSGLLKGEMSLDEDKAAWVGEWSLKDVALLQQGQEFPTALMAGKVYADQKALRIDGGVTGENHAYTGEFSYAYPFAAPQKAALVLNNFSMPWYEGKISTRNVNVPLSGKEDYRLNLRVRRASIDKLMQSFTGEHVKASGKLSGMIPVRIKPDGQIVIGKGALKAEGPGALSFPAQLLPGAGSQMDLTREILQDFRYDVLSLTTENSGKDGLIVRLALEGKNPKVQGGRAVKLNINLTGDVLDFITSSAIVFSNPKALLSKERK